MTTRIQVQRRLDACLSYSPEYLQCLEQFLTHTDTEQMCLISEWIKGMNTLLNSYSQNVHILPLSLRLWENLKGLTEKQCNLFSLSIECSSNCALILPWKPVKSETANPGKKAVAIKSPNKWGSIFFPLNLTSEFSNSRSLKDVYIGQKKMTDWMNEWDWGKLFYLLFENVIIILIIAEYI